MSLPRLNFIVPLEENEEQTRCVARIVQIAKPEWSNNGDKLIIKRLSGGYVNLLLRVSNSEVKDSLIVKVYGANTDQFVDRTREERNFEILHRHGLGAKLHLAFSNGLCYDFTKGNMTSLDFIKTPKVSKMIAQKLAKMHAIPCNEDEMPNFVDSIVKLFDLIPEKFHDPKDQQVFESLCGSKEKLGKQFKFLIGLIDNMKSEKVYCHNDPYHRNMIHNPNTDEIHFIDVEFSGLNPQAYDIGTYFSRYPEMEDPTLNDYPTEEHRTNFVREYLTEFNRLKRRASPSNQDIENLVQESQIAALVNTFIVAVFGFAQQELSAFDKGYTELAINFWSRYVQFSKMLKMDNPEMTK